MSNLEDMIPKVEVKLTAKAFEEAGKAFIDAGILDSEQITFMMMRLKSHCSSKYRKSKAKPSNSNTKKSAKGSKNSSKTGSSKTKKLSPEQEKGMARLNSMVTSLVKILKSPQVPDGERGFFVIIGDKIKISTNGEVSHKLKTRGEFNLMLNDLIEGGLNTFFKTIIETLSEDGEVLAASKELSKTNPGATNPVRSSAIRYLFEKQGLEKHESDASRAFFPIAVLKEKREKKEKAKSKKTSPSPADSSVKPGDLKKDAQLDMSLIPHGIASGVKTTTESVNNRDVVNRTRKLQSRTNTTEAGPDQGSETVKSEEAKTGS